MGCGNTYEVSQPIHLERVDSQATILELKELQISNDPLLEPVNKRKY